jgi:quinone-modifying oxidoreductase subunit QmoC
MAESSTMAETLVVNPDTKFIRDVLGEGGEDLKKCYQCATCTSVCTLSSEESPFPRKQIITAQWGLKDRLLGDPAIWLCHNCGDCTVRCPRDVKPGAVMGALRAQAVKNYAFPRFMGTLTSQPKYLPLLIAVPVLIFGGIAAWGPKEVSRELEFANVFAAPVLEVLFWVVALLAILAYAVGIVRMVNALRQAGHDGKILPALIPAALEIASHKRFAECGAEKSRYWGHLLTLFGFLGLFVVGAVVGVGSLSGLIHTPLSMLNPLKLLANISTLVVAAGLIVMLVERMGSREGRGPNTYFDWFFLLTLVGIVFTGMLSEILRLGESATLMYPVYFVHLVLIFCLFLYGPYSKFSHFIYRTLAMAATWDKRAQAVTKVMTTKEAFA